MTWHLYYQALRNHRKLSDQKMSAGIHKKPATSMLMTPKPRPRSWRHSQSQGHEAKAKTYKQPKCVSKAWASILVSHPTVRLHRNNASDHSWVSLILTHFAQAFGQAELSGSIGYEVRDSVESMESILQTMTADTVSMQAELRQLVQAQKEIKTQMSIVIESMLERNLAEQERNLAEQEGLSVMARSFRSKGLTSELAY